MIALLLKHWQTALLGAVLVFGVGMCRARDNALVLKGAYEAEAAHLAERVADLTHRADSLQSAFRVDTVRLTRSVTKYETLRDTLRLTDTVRVKEALKAADTAISACQRSRQTCSRLVAIKDSIIAKTDSVYSARERHMKSQLKTERYKWAILSFLLGAAVATVQMH